MQPLVARSGSLRHPPRRANGSPCSDHLCFLPSPTSAAAAAATTAQGPCSSSRTMLAAAAAAKQLLLRRSHATVAHAASSAESPAKPMLTLERAIGGAWGTDEELRATGAFAAEVFPDLPIATTWGNLVKALTTRPSSSDSGGHHEEVATAGAMKVTTVAVNLRSMQEVQRRMVAATASPAPVQQGQQQQQQQLGQGPRHQAAGALLFVSGSHPVRSLPGVSRLLPSSVDALKLASDLRRRGGMPPQTQLWAVANPNLEPDASRLEAKVSSGAEVILTQPPFDMAAFQSWLEDANARGLTSQARILVGMPFVSSPANLAFWLSLAGCTTGRPIERLMASFYEASSGGKKDLEEYCERYNARLYQQLLSSSPGVAGLHVMPISAAARRMALRAVTTGLDAGVGLS